MNPTGWFWSGQHPTAQPEKLNDIELGADEKNHYSFGVNLYYMLYKDQLVLTGKINDVGAYTCTNIPNSYRAGIELQGGYMISKYISLAANAAFSAATRSKISPNTWMIMTTAGSKQIFIPKQISPSLPAVIGGTIPSNLLKREISLTSKNVSASAWIILQRKTRSLDPYFTPGYQKWVIPLKERY